MKSALASAERLLGSLDELAVEEAIWLQSGHIGRALAVHRRGEPLLSDLFRLAADPKVAQALGAGLSAWQERRRRNREHLQELREQLAQKGAEIAAARTRLARFVSVYQRKCGPARLQAAV